MTLGATLATGGEAAIAAAGYSMLWYLRRRAQSSEPRQLSKFVATVLVGAAVGIAMGVAGIDVTQGSVEARLVAYAGAVSLVEAVIKSIRDAYKSRTGREA